jgi:hypothetical protein
MRARGVAFAVEGISNLKLFEKTVFDRLEQVVLAKLEEFIPHYQVKVLHAYFSMGYGSGDLYDSLIAKIIQGINSQIYP